MNNRMISDTKLYKVLSIICCIVFAASVVVMCFSMPEFGSAENPTVNEVSDKYLVDSMTDTGATNAVAGMILDYRAFDTLGESCVLFVATVSVFMLLRVDDKKKKDDLKCNEKEDIIMSYTFKALVPVVLLFGIYVIMNGHLSPGGGFSGGAIVSGGLILYSCAYGPEKAEAFMNKKTYMVLSCCALSFYCLAKSYSFYMGANHLESIIKPGTPGAIISGGLILPLNICVGIVVSCTIYALYTLFKRGGFDR